MSTDDAVSGGRRGIDARTSRSAHQVANGSLDVSRALSALSFELPSRSISRRSTIIGPCVRAFLKSCTPGQNAGQNIEISKRIIERGAPLLVTRLSVDAAERDSRRFPTSRSTPLAARHTCRDGNSPRPVRVRLP